MFRFLFSSQMPGGRVEISLTVLKPLFALAVALVLASCELFEPYYKVGLVFPDHSLLTERGLELEAWELRWLEADGAVGQSYVSAADAGGAALTIRKEHPIVVSAQPLVVVSAQRLAVDSESFFKPAGFYRGAGAGRVNECVLKWEDGFGADLLLELAGAGLRPGVINLERLSISLQKRLKGQQGRWWDWDMSRLLANLVSGDLWVYSFRLREEMDVLVALPAGIWLREYLPAEPVEAGDAGNAGNAELEIKLATGFYRFLRQEDGEMAFVWVDGRGVAAIMLE